jgi:acetyl esterase/lipase
MKWSGHIPATRVSDDIVTTMDLMVTLTKWIGAKLPSHTIDGQDVGPLLLGEKNAKGRNVFWYYSGEELHAVREGDWKLHVPHPYLTVAAEPGKGGKPSNYENMKPMSIEESGIKGIASRHGYRVEQLDLALYNLKEDIGERKNVASEQPDVVNRLMGIVEQARAELGDSLTGAKGSGVRPAGDARPPLPPGVIRLANQAYAKPNGRSVLLDLYLPEKEPTTPIPVLVWVHGGGWNAGTKEQCPFIWLATEGYAVASINYRLTYEAQWPAQIDDCFAAVRWLRTNAKTYHLDPNRIACAGGSAGGHLVAVMGTADRPAGEEVSSKVSAVIDMYGPADLLTMPNNDPAKRTPEQLASANGAKLLGGPVKDHPDLAKQASALWLASPGDAPFLILHGDKDPQVPLEQSVRLDAALKKAGVPSELHVVAGAGHGGKGFQTDEVKGWIREFLKRSMPPE